MSRVGDAMALKVRRWRAALAVLVLGLLLTAGYEAEGCDRAAAPGTEPEAKAASRQVVLHVDGLDSQAAEDAVRKLLEERDDLEAVQVEREAGQVSFALAPTGSVERVVEALSAAGYTAHLASEQPLQSKHPRESEHPQPSEETPASEHPEHPEHPE